MAGGSPRRSPGAAPAAVNGPDLQHPPEKATQGFLKFLALHMTGLVGPAPHYLVGPPTVTIPHAHQSQILGFSVHDDEAAARRAGCRAARRASAAGGPG